MTRLFVKFATSTSGATSIEYAMIAFGIAVAIIVAVVSLGSELNTSYTSVDQALQ